MWSSWDSRNGERRLRYPPLHNRLLRLPQKRPFDPERSAILQSATSSAEVVLDKAGGASKDQGVLLTAFANQDSDPLLVPPPNVEIGPRHQTFPIQHRLLRGCR